jgi:hypothetical protein
MLGFVEFTFDLFLIASLARLLKQSLLRSLSNGYNGVCLPAIYVVGFWDHGYCWILRFLGWQTGHPAFSR